MSKFTYIQQRERDDCWVAAIAMFSGLAYEDVRETASRACPDLDLDAGLTLGMLMATVTECAEMPVISHHVAASRPALLCVLSPADQRFGHAVYWDGSRVWDPSPEQPHVDEAWLDKYCYLQIQRVRDLVDISPSRRRVEVLHAMDVKGSVLLPGHERAA